jgi:uncharacterized protein
MDPLSDGPLSDEEIEKLDHFLMHAPGTDEAMDVSMLDGFLTAIVIGPKTITPSEWMRWVWDAENGTDSPEFESTEQAQEILGLLMRHMNDIATTLMLSPGDYEPLLMENPNNGDPIPVIDEWCSGFMTGVQLDSSGWQPMLSKHPDWLAPMILYGTPEGWDALKNDELSLVEHKALAESLADTVRKLHAYWLEQRKAQRASGRTPDIVRRQPTRNVEKVGRNERCPCGSGKKFKHCHGAPGKLH